MNVDVASVAACDKLCAAASFKLCSFDNYGLSSGICVGYAESAPGKCTFEAVSEYETVKRWRTCGTKRTVQVSAFFATVSWCSSVILRCLVQLM